MVEARFTMTPSPYGGEGWGEGAPKLGTSSPSAAPHPTSPKQASCQGFVSFSQMGEGEEMA
jgi:hypothetical protein